MQRRNFMAGLLAILGLGAIGQRAVSASPPKPDIIFEDAPNVGLGQCEFNPTGMTLVHQVEHRTIYGVYRAEYWMGPGVDGWGTAVMRCYYEPDEEQIRERIMENVIRELEQAA